MAAPRRKTYEPDIFRALDQKALIRVKSTILPRRCTPPRLTALTLACVSRRRHNAGLFAME